MSDTLVASDLAAWLRLLLSPGIGRLTARRLLAAFGSPDGIFEAGPHALYEQLGKLSAGLLSVPEGFDEQLRATEQWLAQGDGRQVLTLGDAGYPTMLLETEDPPLLLYLQGRLDLLKAASIAIVGSRNPSPQGEANARAFAVTLSRAGLTIVSGLALGIDGAAHEGGLLGDGSTVAVVGTGLDRVYPSGHLDLARRIAVCGLLVSEFPIGAGPRAPHFPQRNRIIAGLSVGTLVVEAAVKSGSLITAKQAAEMGRDVFAIPGSIHMPQSRGCHALIKQGAKLVESAEDVLDELKVALPRPKPKPKPPMSAHTTETMASESDPLLKAIGADPVTLDSLIARTGMPAHLLNARLLEFELQGLVDRLPGGLFQRRFAA